MQNENILDPSKIDEKATIAKLLAAEPKKNGIYREVYDIVFHEKNKGKAVEIVTVHDASDEECSVSGVNMFIVSKHVDTNY